MMVTATVKRWFTLSRQSFEQINRRADMLKS
jgi:hypothetical protein